MSLYYKKVDALQFKLADEEKELVRTNKAVFFEGSPVKHVGGDQYLAVLQQGENLIRIFEGQWLVRHPDGLWQIYWADKFAQLFIKGDETEAFSVGVDPFKSRAISQPNMLS
jgi:hypothetical protein